MLNKVQFIGYLGRDVELRYLPSGAAIANFSVASTEKWKDKGSGEMQERTEWLRCNAFDRLAEICGEWLKKGSLVYVEGNLQTRKWTDKDGIEKYSTECRLSQMKMLGGKLKDADGEGDSTTQQQGPAPHQRAGKPQVAKPDTGTGFDDMDDDIPF